MEPGCELGFLLLSFLLPLPLPLLHGSRCAACVSPGSPLCTPQMGSCGSQNLVPSSSPQLGQSLGIAVESSTLSACLPCNPPSFLPPTGLFVGKFKADECWGALGLRARR